MRLVEDRKGPYRIRDVLERGVGTTGMHVGDNLNVRE